MARRILCGLLLLALLCGAWTAGQAAEKLNIYIDKAALLDGAAAQDVRIRPEGKARVTRCALHPWDEAGAKYALLIEIENTSQEKIVFDESWLYALNEKREEIGEAYHPHDGTMKMTTNAILPGERCVMSAGVYPYRTPVIENGEVVGETAEEGLERLAPGIRRAATLRLRFETRGEEASSYWQKADIPMKAWIEAGQIVFEAENPTQTTLSLRTVGAVMTEESGRLIDMIETTLAAGAEIAPGQTLRVTKALAPYIDGETAAQALFEPFAYRYKNP